MAKKAKRQVRKTAAAGQAKAEEQYSGFMGKSNDREFNPDYTPVIKDLKRIGALAGSFILLLVVLSFFLR
ncbi:MAG: hypothetical protein PHS96_12140 [Anaerolineales bacterium]|nr:hypothetical protein [Anaerolineales bacterium]